MLPYVRYCAKQLRSIYTYSHSNPVKQELFTSSSPLYRGGNCSTQRIAKAPWLVSD